MNFIEAKEIILNQICNLQIKCICGSYIIHDKNRCDNFYCLKCSLHIIEFQESGIYMNIINDAKNFWCGFSLNNSKIYNDIDIYVDLDDFINIAKIADFNKYIEKYNNLILFK
jgi:hypothetical protein